MNNFIALRGGLLPIAYIVVGVLHVVFVFCGLWQGIYATKYLLMPLLMAWLWAQGRALPRTTRYLLTVALCFAFIGDIVLMMASPTDKEQFLLGLGAFLCMHLCYISAFMAEWRSAVDLGLLSRRRVLVLPFVLFAAGLLYAVKDFLGQNNMWLPVGFYAMTICAMSLAALNRYGRVPALSFRWVFAGALLFMLSDSCIAIKRFAAPFAFDNELIMITYIAAQGLIVGGILFLLPTEART